MVPLVSSKVPAKYKRTNAVAKHWNEGEEEDEWKTIEEKAQSGADRLYQAQQLGQAEEFTSGMALCNAAPGSASTMAVLKSSLAKQWDNGGEAISRLLSDIDQCIEQYWPISWTILTTISNNFMSNFFGLYCIPWQYRAILTIFVYKSENNITRYFVQYYIHYCKLEQCCDQFWIIVIDIEQFDWTILCTTWQCDSKSHFNRSFGNEKAFNLKKIKIIAEPVAAMAAGGPAAGGDGRQVPQADQRQDRLWTWILRIHSRNL